MTSPTQDPKTNALGVLSYLAEVNIADATNAGLDVYATAGATGLMDRNLASYNSALNSAAIKGANVDTTAEVQSVVNAYNAIRSYTNWLSDAVAPTPTAAQYAAIGVTGITGSVNATGTALHLLNDSVYRANPDATDSVAELQTMVNAAKHVIAAAGGTANQAAALNVQDFTSLGVTGVTTDNLAVVQSLIRSVTSDARVDTGVEIQNLINAKLESRHDKALATIQQAAQSDTATGHLGLRVYAIAGVTGVDAANLASVNSALDSAKVNGMAADTTAEVQAIVNAYNAVLASADAVHGNTHLPLTLAQYAAIGVTGVSGAVAQPFIRTDGGAFMFGTAADKNADVQAGSVTDPVTGLTLNIVIPNGSDWHLLNDVVDASAKTAVDSAKEVQAIASAANHVIQAAGGTMEQAAAVTLADLKALGIQGVTADNLVKVQTGLALTGSDYAVDTQAELQSLVEAALAATPTALHTISAAADSDTAASSMLRFELFGLAGVTGVNLGNFRSIYSALDSEPIDVTRTDSTAEVQTLVNAYNAILHSADGVGGNTVVQHTATDYSAIGVTGVAEATHYIVYEAPTGVELGMPAPAGTSQEGSASSIYTGPYPGGLIPVTDEGSALHLLNDVVDSSAKTSVDTVPELQAMANAAAHVIAAVGGTAAAAEAVTGDDLVALGIPFLVVMDTDITHFRAALQALSTGAAVDTRAELLQLVNHNHSNDFDTSHLGIEQPVVPAVLPF